MLRESTHFSNNGVQTAELLRLAKDFHLDPDPVEVGLDEACFAISNYGSVCTKR